MSFCSSCGTDVGDAAFCPKCGNKIVGDDRKAKDSVEKVDNFNAKECLNELTTIIRPLQEIEQSNSKVNKFEKRIKNKEKLIDSVMWLIMSFSWVIILNTFFTILVDGLGIFSVVFPIIFFVGIPIGWIVFYFVATKSSFCKSIKGKMTQKDRKMQDEYNRSSQKTYQMIYQVLLKYLPQDYWYSDAVSTIASYFRNMRVDSMKEAINLYESENMQAAILYENRRQTVLAAITAVNTFFID